MISVGLIGCGDVAEHGHVPALIRHPKFRIAAVCDVLPQRAELLATRAGNVPSYSDWRKLLQNERLDAVVAALPPEISADVVIACLKRGLAVLDEKPLAASLADGQRLAETVTSGNHIYQCGFVLRYGEWVRQIAQSVKSLGLPLNISAEVYDERYDSSKQNHLVRIQSFLKNSSAMTHEGSHIVDYASIWNPAEWVRVSSFARKTSPDFLGPNVWNSKVELADLSTLNIKVAWLLPEIPHSVISIEGPHGRVYFNCVTGQGELEVGSERTEMSVAPTKPEWDKQYDAFADAFDRDGVSCATVHDALRALEITTACELSVENGGSVSREELYRVAGNRNGSGKQGAESKRGKSLSA
jgi:predicted dehydrogenase